MHITGMKIGEIAPFTEPIEFKCDERVNVFIGPNASGKSTLMRAARTLLRNPYPHPWDEALFLFSWVSHSPDWPLVKDRPKGTDPHYDASDPYSEALYRDRLAAMGNAYDLEAFPVISVPSIRVEKNLNTRRREPGAFLSGTAFEYSQERAAVEASVKRLLDPYGEDGGWSVLYAEAIEHATRLMLEHARELNAIFVRENVRKAVALAQHCAYQICNEVLVGNDVPEHNTITRDVYDDDMNRYNEEITEYFIQTSIRHSHDRLPMYALSSGTETTMWWLRFIALNIVHHYGFVDGWENRPAILLIDEIENHLHPTWQRRVIPALLEHFPGLQIFATTHSPFVVAGLKAGQVHLLNRDENGVVSATTNTEDIVGWTADEILRAYMGVEDPTDKETAEAAADLRRLRDAGPQPDEREEEQRQARMQELRERVNRDLLTGSARAAEEERFAENLTHILERYRLSRDLNQENG